MCVTLIKHLELKMVDPEKRKIIDRKSSAPIIKIDFFFLINVINKNSNIQNSNILIERP